MAQYTKKIIENKARSIESMVVAPEEAESLDLRASSFVLQKEQQIEKEGHDNPISNEELNPFSSLPRPDYMANVPTPLKEKVKLEPTPQAKISYPDPDSRTANKSYLEKSAYSYKFSPDKWRIFCLELEQSGLVATSALKAGVQQNTVISWRKSNPDFAEMYEESMARYRDVVVGEVYRRAIKGVKENVYGKDGKLGTKVVYSDRLLELEAKRVEPSYRERGGVQMDVAMNGGVLVVRDRADVDEKAWGTQYNSGKPVEQKEPTVINVGSSPVAP